MVTIPVPPQNEGVLAELWARQADGLRRWFRRAVGSREDAEDLTIQVFLRLAAALEQGNVREPEAVLRLTAQSVLKNHLRDRSRQPSTVSWEQTSPEKRDALASRSFNHNGLATFPTDFDSAVRALDPPERDAFILTDLRGLSSREAADVLGVSHVTVQGRRRSAVEAIREEL